MAGKYKRVGKQTGRQTLRYENGINEATGLYIQIYTDVDTEIYNIELFRVVCKALKSQFKLLLKHMFIIQLQL